MSVALVLYILFSIPLLTLFYQFHGRGQYVEGGTCKRFLSEDRISHSAFFHISITVERQQEI